MSTNVYRCEKRIYFGDEPCVTQGYHMSTTSASESVTIDEDTWQKVEGRVKELFPNADTVRVAGFAVIENADKDLAYEARRELELELDGMYDKEVHSVCDLIEAIMCDTPLENLGTDSESTVGWFGLPENT